MTERRRGLPVVAVAAGLFCVVLIYLTMQVRAGRDPAIGSGTPTAAVQRPRQVILRRVIIRRVVEEPAPASVPEAGTAASGATASASVPVAAPAAPASAPAPPPPPAAVVSQGS